MVLTCFGILKCMLKQLHTNNSKLLKLGIVENMLADFFPSSLIEKHLQCLFHFLKQPCSNTEMRTGTGIQVLF